MSRWSPRTCCAGPQSTVGRISILRHKDLTGSGARSSELTIRDVDRVVQSIRLEVPATGSSAALVTTFANRASLVMPRLIGTTILRLVDSRVITALASGPFAASAGTCSVNPAQAPPAIAGFTLPRNRNQLIAAYESAASHNCGAIRPAAECKMRDIVQKGSRAIDFCFVCRYAIVEAIDCASHPDLDKQYPR